MKPNRSTSNQATEQQNACLCAAMWANGKPLYEIGKLFGIVGVSSKIAGFMANWDQEFSNPRYKKGEKYSNRFKGYVLHGEDRKARVPKAIANFLAAGGDGILK